MLMRHDARLRFSSDIQVVTSSRLEISDKTRFQSGKKGFCGTNIPVESWMLTVFQFSPQTRAKPWLKAMSEH
jgi:hypothetical protein